ncbi:MAG: LysE family translocator [Alphaproteobacteria bacterium]
MLTFSTILAFMGTCAIIESTPGPNMGYLAILSLSNGRRAGFAATIGIALGLLIVGLAAALGIAAIISSSPVLYQSLRWGGVGYMLYLAWEGWRGEEETSASATKTDTHAKFFKRGLIVNLLNPKAAVFYVAILPSFVEVSTAILPQTIILTLIFVAIATTIHGLVVMLAGSLRPYLENPRYNMIARRVLSILLALVAIWFGFDTAR